MTKPPAGASLLFGVLADSGKIKQRKNGKFTMVLEGVDEIDWFTDHPERVEGTWKPQKLLRKWDRYFASSEPNAQVTVEVGEQRELFTFEMFPSQPYKSGKMTFNIKPLSDSGEDKLTGLQDMELSDISLFIDDGTSLSNLPACFPNCAGADLHGTNLTGANLTNVDLFEANLTRADLTNVTLSGESDTGRQLTSANLTDADLTDANLPFANMTRANLTEANLTGAKLHQAYFFGANLTGANLTQAVLTTADFDHTYLTNANLTGADISGGTGLTSANLRGAHLYNANLTEAQYDSKTIWPAAEYWGNTTCPDGSNSDNNPSCGF